MPDNIVTNTMLPVGAVLNGRYRIERHLSSGGFGNTYVATNEFGEQVAIKEFFIKGVNQRDSNNTTVSVSNSENRDQFTQQCAKFKKEAMRLRGLQSPHIVKVLSFFEENGTAFYVMNYIDGESLSQRLQRQGAMAENEVSNILNQVLEALDEVHNSQPPLYHLDIKPGNIMVDRQGGAHLIDFGASKQMDASTGGATASTQAAFTKGYAPLEQVEGRMDKIGPWTDFYALGATLYRLLTNQTPPQYSDIQDEGAAAFHFPASVTQPMRDLIQWMMQPQRTKRPQSVAEVRQHFSLSEMNSTPPQIVPVITTQCQPDNVTIIRVTADSSSSVAAQHATSEGGGQSLTPASDDRVNVWQDDETPDDEEKTNYTPWIIGFLAAIALIIFFIHRNGSTEPVEDIVDSVYVDSVGNVMKSSEEDAKLYQNETSTDSVFYQVDQPPQFPGGDEALMRYLANHIQYPPKAIENNVQGKVVVQFVVEKDGHIGGVKVVRSVDKDLDREAVRVCKSLPGFIPGRNNGQYVSVWYTLPVFFKLK